MALKQKYNPISSTFDMVNYETSDLSTKQNVNSWLEELTPIDVTLDKTTRTLSISWTVNSKFTFYALKNGEYISYEKTWTINFPVWTENSWSWYFYFDKDWVATTSQIMPENFNENILVYKIVLNTEYIIENQVVAEYFMWYKSCSPSIDREYKKSVSWSIWYNWFNCYNNATISWTPNADGRNSTISLTSWKIIDQNIEFSFTNSENLLPFNQQLWIWSAALLNSTNSWLFNITYRNANWHIELKTRTRFPFLFNETTNIPQYINPTTFLPTDVSNNNFFVSFIYATWNKNIWQWIRATPAYSQFYSLNNANAITWDNIKTTDSNYDNPNIRPLYKLIFEYKGVYSADCKHSVLRQVTDIRKAVISQTTLLGWTIPATSVTTNVAWFTNTEDAISFLNSQKLTSYGSLKVNSSTSTSLLTPPGWSGPAQISFSSLWFVWANGIPTNAKVYWYQFLINFNNTWNYVPAVWYVHFLTMAWSNYTISGFPDVANQNFVMVYNGLAWGPLCNMPYRVTVLWGI